MEFNAHNIRQITEASKSSQFIKKLEEKIKQKAENGKSEIQVSILQLSDSDISTTIDYFREKGFNCVNHQMSKNIVISW